ncbi:MAG: hypothetical protein U9P42_04600 [Candidatus Fermentibacteria bacterium]|nr:hypothetical protein [Candidatus Fermentibacteria bacterium]
MTQENKPISLDAEIDDSRFERDKGPPKKKKESKLLPYLLGGLVLLAGYYFISGGSSSGVQMDLTPEQVQVQTDITDVVESYVSENGSLPDDPTALDLPEGSEIIMGDDGSWIVSTTDGQLIFSEDALAPFEDGPQ